MARFASDANLDIDLVQSIAKCESQFNPNAVSPTNDVGVMQINVKYHLEKSKKLGYDIFDLIGNIRYGIFLIQTDGTRHYLASKKCWLKELSKLNSSLSVNLASG